MYTARAVRAPDDGKIPIVRDLEGHAAEDEVLLPGLGVEGRVIELLGCPDLLLCGSLGLLASLVRDYEVLGRVEIWNVRWVSAFMSPREKGRTWRGMRYWSLDPLG